MLITLRSKFSTFGQWFLKHRKWCIGITVFLLFVSVGTFFITDPAAAETGASGGFWVGFTDALLRAIATIFISMARFFLRIALFFMYFIIQLAAYNGYLDSVPVNVGWTVMLNITNMFFVVILLVIAFATILGIDQYEWKKLLPKFFLSAVLINFSRTICGVLIDASQVIMTTFISAVATSASTLYIKGFGLEKLEKFHSNIQSTDLVAPGIFISALGAVFFATMIMGVFGAYLFILAGRLIRLWILIILSPLAFALSALPKTQSFASSWWSELGDNLVTGPVLVFFMWLSLVVAGSGNIADHISSRSNVPESQQFAPSDSAAFSGTDSDTDSDKEKAKVQNAGLTQILEWSNIANFIIAIGLLLAGAQVASKIGGSSGNLMMSGINFGKKVATLATGVAAGQWLYGGAKQAVSSTVGAVGGYALDKAPLIGRDAWKRRATAIGGRASLLRGKIEEWQSGVAADMEKVSGPWYKRAGARALGSIVESSGRKMKKAEDWQDAAKYQAKIVEETYSTSKLPAGQIKLDTAQRATMVEHLAKAKKDLKFAQKEEELEHIAEKIEKAQRELVTAQKSGDSMAVGIAEAKLAEFNSDDINYANRRKAMLESRAEAEQRKKQLHDAEGLSVAEARDKYLEKTKGIGGGYLDKEEASQAKEALERAGVASYDKSMAKVDLIFDKINDPNNKNNTKLLQSLQKEYNNLQVANINRGAIFATSGEYNARKALGIEGKNGYEYTAEINQNNLMAQQAEFLSTKVGRKVATNSEAIQKALDEVEKTMGAAYIEQMADGLNHMAEEGASHYAGLFKGEMHNGQYKIRPSNMTDDDEFIRGKKGWAVKEARFTNRNIKGFDSSVDKIQGKVRIKTSAARENMTKFFSGMTTQNINNADLGNIDTIADAISNAEGNDEIKEIFNALKNAAAGDDRQKRTAVNALVDRIKQSAKLKNEALLSVAEEVLNSSNEAAEATQQAAEAIANAVSQGTNNSQTPPQPQPRNPNKRAKRNR